MKALCTKQPVLGQTHNKTTNPRPRTAASLWVAFGVLRTLLYLTSAPAVAQTSARVNGFVQDESGAVVPGAIVVLKDEASGTEIRGVTGSSRLYRFDPVPPTTYTVTIQKDGKRRRV